MLETPGANLSRIAQRAGFADQAHFPRLFRRTYGITPGALMRQLLHEQPLHPLNRPRRPDREHRDGE
jgi:AraC-like DNA-binding protein